MESYSEDAAQNAIDNFNSSAMGAQAYEEEIKRVQKNDQLTNDQRNAAINQLKAKQEELAASAGTTVEALLGTDVSSLMDGIITDSASVTTALDGINKAYEEQNTDVTSLVDTLGKYTSEQLEGIDFNDGKWDTEDYRHRWRSDRGCSGRFCGGKLCFRPCGYRYGKRKGDLCRGNCRTGGRVFDRGL